MLWGYSPAQDLLGAILRTSRDSIQPGQHVNILLAGSSDPRHILKTIGKYYTHGVEVTIHFYVAEVLIDFVARELLLLTLALEPSASLPLFHKTRLWMELFANALVRPKTMEYLLDKSQQLIYMVTDPEFISRRLPCVDLSDLKYQEKDKLDFCFQYWMKNNFNISQHWDGRLRRKLGVRYDSKDGVFDWDYFMKMKDKPGNLLIAANEYKQWRKNGVAFVWLETEYCLSNPTFAMGVHASGDRLAECGYYGDMDVGAYYTFATDCEDEEMLAKSQHSNAKRATDIFERNLCRTLHEIEHQKPYTHEGEDVRNLGNVVLKINELDLNPKPRLEAMASKMKETYSSIPIKHKIHFLHTKSIEQIHTKSKFINYFDAVFVAQSMEKLLLKSDNYKEFFKVLKNGATLIWETRKALLDVTKEGLTRYEDAVKLMMNEHNCESTSGVNFGDDFTATYVKNIEKKIDVLPEPEMCMNSCDDQCA